MDYQLRAAQEAILAYDGGRMAVSAVPGSGKTFTLSLLAANLIAEEEIDVAAGQQILIVTYLNASVETFKARIRQRLQERGLPQRGFDVRTLHSLGLEIVRTAAGGEDERNGIVVLDEIQAGQFLSQAVGRWIDNHPAWWRAFLPEDTLKMRTRWRNITEQTAKAFIRTAKNERYRPAAIERRLQAQGDGPDPAMVENQSAWQEPAADNGLALVRMLNGIYAHYQQILARQGALDFDDLIWEAADLLETRPDLAETLQWRWPYILEDEAQDSVPLQEALLGALAGPDGNWVRVGDPNQAITSTFTAAHPRYFNAFIDRPDVVARPLPNSGRSAPRIYGAANTLLHWVVNEHPVAEVRAHTFREQDIQPTPPGDAQPNPPDSPHNMRIKVYEQREDEELPAIARLAQRYASARPTHTLAILVPTNNVGYAVAEQLDILDAAYDNLLRGGTREREIAAAMHGLLALLADPLDTRALVGAHEALLELEHQAVGSPDAWGVAPTIGAETRAAAEKSPELERFHALLRSVHRPEQLLFPEEDGGAAAALPEGVATAADRAQLQPFLAFLRRIFDLRDLPIDDLTLALGDELFARAPAGDSEVQKARAHEFDLAVAYQIANVLRRWRDVQPEWRLPELVAQLGDVASGRRTLPTTAPGDLGFEPEPGRITLATQHGAKGLEWDAVFLMGIDGFWIPGSLDASFLGVPDFLDVDPTAEATANLRHLMAEDSDLYPGRTATESAHIEVIGERLRLLYVGITRARRYLHISRSRTTRRYDREREAEPATVLGVLYRYLQQELAEADSQSG